MSVAPKKSGGAADLDSLLNLGNPTSSKPSNQFITPAEKIVKTDPGEEIIERNSDYFKMPEISSMNKESTIINSMDNNMFLSRKGDREESEDDDEGNDDLPSIDEIKQTGPYTIEDATHKIRKLVEELKEHGINITTNEMNFEKSYQVIIKIEKE
jgi:biotin operon repressor